MRYFIHGGDICAVETEEQAAKYADAGWRAVSRETFMAAWRKRDAQSLAEMEPVFMTAPLAAQKPGTMIERLPNGWARYSV